MQTSSGAYTLRVEQRDRTGESVSEPVERGETLLVVHPNRPDDFREARLSVVPHRGGSYLDISVGLKGGAASLAGTLRRDGSTRWGYASEVAGGRTRELTTAQFIASYGAYVDALLALLFQRLRSGDYALKEFP